MLDNTVIFATARHDFVLTAIQSLREYTHPCPVVITVNQSQPDSQFEHELWELSDLVIRPKVNYGFAQAYNLGTRLATTQYVSISNDDVVFLPGWWDGVLETFASFQEVLAVAPMSPKEPGWGYGEPGYRVHATLRDCLLRPTETIAMLKDKWKGAVVDAFAAWLMVAKRKEWVELGMFDERFFPGGGEDYDACARAYQAGYRMLSSSKSWVWHHWGQTKDAAGGLSQALPPRQAEGWNKLSTKGFGAGGLWDPDCNVWGRDCKRTDNNIRRESL